MVNIISSDEFGNRLDLSKVSKFEGVSSFKQFAIKYVISGEETYYIKHHKYVVKQGEFLLGNNAYSSEAKINQPTAGICIDISMDIILEIAQHYFNQHDFQNYLLGNAFFTEKYNCKTSHLGGKISQLVSYLLKNPSPIQIEEQLYHELGEALVLEQAGVFRQISKLNYSNHLYSHENFKRLKIAKQFIDDSFLNPTHLDELASVACMSKFRFTRLFKQVFGISPHQYILKKRLEAGQHLLAKGKPVTEVAITTGFSDVASFSKAFKAKFLVTPSKFY